MHFLIITGSLLSCIDKWDNTTIKTNNRNLIRYKAHNNFKIL